MSDPSGAPRPDTGDMLAVHGVFRDCLGAAPTLVGSIAPDDAERVGLIANDYDNILSFLEAHHEGEEAVLFPLLRQRCAGTDELMDQMAEQHYEALALLAETRTALAAWPGGDAAAQVVTQESLDALLRHLIEHLDERRRRCFPWRAATSRWPSGANCPRTVWPTFHGDKLWRILGLIRERMTDSQQAAMTAYLPPPLLEMWTGFGEQAHHDYASVVVVEVADHA